MSEASATIPGTPTELDFSRIPPDALDEQQHIVCELPCRQCGYNL
ncbi:MAG: hypothetical protein AAGH99_02515 [Planctomycetota bacterium]